MSNRWFPLESNPSLLNAYISRLGFDTARYNFVDVLATAALACVCVCVGALVRVRVHACECVRARACARARVCASVLAATTAIEGLGDGCACPENACKTALL